MATKKEVNKSNGYSSRKFWTGLPKNGTIPESFTMPTPTDSDAIVAWSPTLKKYFFADTASAGKVYSQSPEGQKILVHTCSGTVYGCHWSKTLSMLVVMTSTHIYTSANGVDFTSRTVPASYAPDANMSTFVDASTYLLVFGKESSTGYMYKTTDGITWVRSASGTGSSTRVVAGAIGDTVGYSNGSADTSETVRYTTNGTTYASATLTSNGSVYVFYPPTPIRPFFWAGTNNQTYSSSNGITYTSNSMPLSNAELQAFPKWFGGIMANTGSAAAALGEYMSKSAASPSFVIGGSSAGVYAQETFVSIEGEYATYTNRTKAHKVGTWLDIGDHEVWLIGGGAPNANTSVGGTAGFLTIHRLTVTEKWRYCVYVYLGAAAIVDTQTGQFLAYASMLTSTSTSAQTNWAGFGSEVYPGLGAGTSTGAACGPSNGGGAFMSADPASMHVLLPGNTEITSKTPPDWWTPWDWAGNRTGTGYPGTVGSSAAQVGLLGACMVAGSPSFGAGGSNTSTALTQVGGEALCIIYSR